MIVASRMKGRREKHSAVESSPPSRPGKLKSAERRKQLVMFSIPKDGVSFVLLERNARSKYEELTLAEFVAGYAQNLLS